MTTILEIKKPKYVGTEVELQIAKNLIGMNRVEKEQTRRRLIGQAFKGKTVHVFKNGNHRLIVCEQEKPTAPMSDLEYEGEAALLHVQKDGGVVLSFLKEHITAISA